MYKHMGKLPYIMLICHFSHLLIQEEAKVQIIKKTLQMPCEIKCEINKINF